ENDQQQLSININDIPITFEQIKFVPSKWQSVHTTWYSGYYHMCQFNAIMLHKHPLITYFDYYWRLDSHSYIMTNINYDLFDFMRINHLKYGFIMVDEDADHYLTNLWETFTDYLKHHCLSPSENIRQAQTNFFAQYNMKIIYNNFFIVKTDIWQQPQISNFLSHLDKVGGIYKYRWGDAPIHTLIISQFLNRNEVVRFRDIGYFHKQEFVCPNTITSECNPKEYFLYKNERYHHYKQGCNSHVITYPLCHYYPEKL
ncbi:unnamed protein product, partial [Didymodactylos carnosus]